MSNFLILRRTDPSTGIVDYCMTGGYYWTRDIYNAKEFLGHTTSTQKRAIKTCINHSKKEHSQQLNFAKNNQWGYQNQYIPQTYIYEIVPVTKTIVEDNANAIVC